MSFTITFGDVAENHKGMQNIGTLALAGMSISELQEIEFPDTEIVNLTREGTPEAQVLIIRNAIDADFLFAEMKSLDWDTKALMYGAVRNKHARHNLCFSDISQDPDYESGKGRIYSFNSVPELQKTREIITNLHPKFVNLQAEGNYYYDKTCGIGYHGDAERKIVVGVRLGDPFPLCYRWYCNGVQTSETIQINLQHGDIYIMSEKAVGNDWKRKKVHTLRHAAGAQKYINT